VCSAKKVTPLRHKVTSTTRALPRRQDRRQESADHSSLAVVCSWTVADQRWPLDPSAAHHWHVADQPQPRSAGPHIGGGAPLLPRPRAHAWRLGAGGGSGCARPGAPALSAGGSADACQPLLPHGAGGCRRYGAVGHRGGQNKLPPACAHAQRRRGAAAGGHRRRGAGSGVPQPWPRATPSGGAAKASGGAATGGPMASNRRRRCRCPPAGRRRGGRPRPPTPQRRCGDAAMAVAIAVMGTPVNAAVTALAAPAAGRGGLGAAHPSGGRAAPGARPPQRPPRRGWRRLRRPHGSGGCVSDAGRCTWRQTDGARAPYLFYHDWAPQIVRAMKTSPPLLTSQRAADSPGACSHSQESAGGRPPTA